MKLKLENVQRVLDMAKIGRITRTKISDELKCTDPEARAIKILIDNIPLLSKLGISNKLPDGDGERVLLIGDTHEPFTREGYLQFCVEMYNKWNCTKVVFAGDILDNHFSSYHETDPDGHAAGTELALAKEHVKMWHDTFPNAKVCIGNHDAIPNRKAMTAGISSRWIKTPEDVLETPTWEFGESFIIDGVLYNHGTGRKARQRARQDMISVAQGHYHSESYVEWFVGKRDKIFALQVGCGMDDRSFASAYGKHFQKMHINVGIILYGKTPFLEYMDL